jgi:rfaE bifunctional protein kinase chain/domain
MRPMDAERLDEMLSALREKTLVVLGDFCVDRYLEIDPDIRDVSAETGLPIHQVVRVRPEPGGGANVVRNAATLGVGTVQPVGLIGEDGEGFELSCLFESLGVSRDLLRVSPGRHTPAYTKPLVLRSNEPPEELSRFDIFPREPLSPKEEAGLIIDLRAAFEEADGLIVADYGEAGKCGVVGPRLREVVAELARTRRDTPVVADSRLLVDKFRQVVIKPNAHEAMRFLGGEPEAEPNVLRLTEIGQRTAERNQRPVVITLGPNGALLCAPGRAQKVPAYPSEEMGPIDPVGSGDTVLAALAAALAAGAPLDDAAVFAMVAASITVQQIGTCGSAAPDPIRERFREYADRYPDVVAS